MKPYILIDGDNVALISNPDANHLEPWEIKRGYEAFKEAKRGLYPAWDAAGREYVATRMKAPFPVRPEPYTLETDRVWAEAIDQRASLEGDLWREYGQKYPRPEHLFRESIFDAYVALLCKDFGFTAWDSEDYEPVRL